MAAAGGVAGEQESPWAGGVRSLKRTEKRERGHLSLGPRQQPELGTLAWDPLPKTQEETGLQLYEVEDREGANHVLGTDKYQAWNRPGQ